MIYKLKIDDDENFNYIKDDVENIMTQQIIISQLAKGISYEDTNNMDNYERIFIFKKLLALEKEKTEAKLKALEDAKSQSK